MYARIYAKVWKNGTKALQIRVGKNGKNKCLAIVCMYIAKAHSFA
jgi:hypothetical protein